MIIEAKYTTFLCIMCILPQNLPWTSAELFLAISDMESLLETQKEIVDKLHDYISKTERTLEILKEHQKRYKKEHMMAMEDIPNYLGNPVNAFTLIKGLTTGLDFIENTIKIGTDSVWNMTMKNANVKYPNLEDLTGAAQALTRLQETYNLDIGELAEGKLNGIAYSTAMTADDCYELGRTLYNKKDYVNSLRWMTEALRKFKDQNDLYNFSEVDIIEYIGTSHSLLGDVEQALEWTNKLLVLEPNHLRARKDIIDFERTIQERKAKLQKQIVGETDKRVDVEENLPPVPSSARQGDLYASLCRGEIEINSEMKKKLKCSYLTENHPFLKLAPIKMEQVYIGPDIYLFHQVMSDDEIEHVKEMAKPRFKRATVVDFDTGKYVTADFRISKSGWLKNEESEVIARISRRVADFTGLSMDSAEDLQVVNYGIGGHYIPHFDYTMKHAFKIEKDNRIATVLFYMSEVAQGGATVFTELGLSVFPVKNAAVFWMNLHPSGEGDIATKHAACPVLRGSKWVSNKWIHQIGQELLKPCTLEHQREEDMREIPKFQVPLSSR